MEHKVIRIEKTRTPESTQDPKTASSFKIKAVQEYTTELSVVVAILQCSENTFWIHDFSAEKTIQKISLQNDSKIKVLLNLKEYAFRTALMGNGDLLISDETSNLKILKMNATKLTTSVYNLNPYIALSLHCSSDKKVIVGGTKKLPIDYSVSEGGVVIVMDLEAEAGIIGPLGMAFIQPGKLVIEMQCHFSTETLMPNCMKLKFQRSFNDILEDLKTCEV
ncbi:unnamed protein product [Mytilus edulis]|uniref:Uncharacterized protein n=1 Tax=Mytilus edulis TaxID=6550 RepID=A0A8S3UCP0_MYTED|nr:unnamed protein product [Mytilus edulis]